MENFYETLGVAEDADADFIRKAFRALAKKYHPDMQDADEVKFRGINHAYSVLINPDSRRDYDRTLANFRTGAGDFESYTSGDLYEVQGRHIKKLLNELMRQTELTRVKIKYEGRTLIDLPLTTAVSLTMLGLAFAPLATILINIGVDRFFQVEVVNALAVRYEKAAEAHSAGDLIEAERIYKEIIDMSEYFLPAHLNLGMLYRQRGENKLAVERFRHVLEVAPFGEIGNVARSNLEALRGY